jgi:hypothetical protein
VSFFYLSVFLANFTINNQNNQINIMNFKIIIISYSVSIIAVQVLEVLFKVKASASFGMVALIITPTRELAFQIFEVLQKICSFHDFTANLIIGGKVCQVVSTIYPWMELSQT